MKFGIFRHFPDGFLRGRVQVGADVGRRTHDVRLGECHYAVSVVRDGDVGYLCEPFCKKWLKPVGRFEGGRLLKYACIHALGDIVDFIPDQRRMMEWF